ncbi:hypothetical protein Q3O59_14060 [Alkalimonas delamerensis]|uniref:DUF2975 domain-containing protein n=1 Tax=Alkalimonas delamerensis TaxID=265981 RepID=A0ABT9GT48_9GAMM|nr:hypothetical protein [Alkalimonas delamerensis]MDP4530149.1 hypothetical protein [Alkalimonas delamerensis]
MIIQQYAKVLYQRSRLVIWALLAFSLVHTVALLPDLLFPPEQLDRAQQRALWLAQLVSALGLGLIIQRLLLSASQGQLFQPASRALWMQLASGCLVAALFPALFLCSLLLYWGQELHLLTLLAQLNLPLIGLGCTVPLAVAKLKLSAQLEDEQNLTI